MDKLKAAAIHLAISAVVVGVVLSIVFFIWYPAPTFVIAGALGIIFILIAVDLVLGPLLTLIVYKKGKKSLKFDLTVIAIIQLVALAYGAHTLYMERPYYMVFNVDRFNIVSEKQIDKEQLRYDELREKPFAETIRVFARLPEGQEFQDFLDSVLVDGLPDLESRPEFYEPYSNGIEYVKSRIRPLSDLVLESDLDEQRVAAAEERYRVDFPEMGYVPVGALKEDMALLMDRATAEPIGILKVNPWTKKASE